MNIFLITWLLSIMSPVQLKVEVQNISNSKGYVLVGIYSSPDGFRDTEKAIAHARVPAQNGNIIVEIPNLPPGIYAAAIIHDANSNGKLDTNFLGIPTEAYGFSNNARGSFGPPSFEACKFEIKKDAIIRIQIK
jgi:uncharacterized protein (DUF2141 family)